MLKNKNIIITGAAGFIGSHLTDLLLKNNNFAFLIDNFNDYYLGKKEQLTQILDKFNNNNYKLIEGDLIDSSIFNEINKEVNVIFHLAAQAGVRYSIQNAAEITNNNITSTVNIFEYALQKKLDKIVFASSSSVYGNPQYTPVDEEHPKNPISPYAVSKLSGELYADYYFREYGLPITSLRFYTVYGPRGRPDMAIRKFFNKMLRDEEIIVYGDGEQLRDFTYVSDIVNGLVLSAQIDKASGEIFNLGCSNPISVNSLVDKMYSIIEKPKKLKYIEKQKGDVEITHSDISKASKILGFKPKINIDEGLQLQYNWQKSL